MDTSSTNYSEDNHLIKELGGTSRKKVSKSHTQKRERSPTKPLKEQNIEQELGEKWPQKRGRN